jgi:hypothetical protein
MSNLFKWNCGNFAPEGIAWTPVFTGFSADPLGVYRYILVGKLCIAMVRIYSLGTSNADTFALTAPFKALTLSSMQWGCLCWRAYDYGNLLTTPAMALISDGDTSISVYKDLSMSGWTTSGYKGANFTLIYETA